MLIGPILRTILSRGVGANLVERERLGAINLCLWHGGFFVCMKLRRTAPNRDDQPILGRSLRQTDRRLLGSQRSDRSLVAASLLTAHPSFALAGDEQSCPGNAAMLPAAPAYRIPSASWLPAVVISRSWRLAPERTPCPATGVAYQRLMAF